MPGHTSAPKSPVRKHGKGTMDHRRGADGRFAVSYFALFSVFGVLTPYFQKLLDLQGFHEKQIGTIFAVYETVGLIAPPLWGWFSDHSRHRRRLLLTAILATLVFFLAFGWITAFWLALLVAIPYGFFYRPIIPLTDGMLLRYMEEHGGDYGRPRSAGSFSFMLVIVVMELLGVAGSSGRGIILGTVAVCSLLHAASVAVLPLTAREKAERATRTRQKRHIDLALFRSRPFVAFAVAAFLSRLGMMGYYSYFTLYLQKEIGFQQAGYIWIIGPLAEIPVIFFSSAIIRRIGMRTMFALGTAAAAVRLTGFALAPTVGWIIPLQLLHALTFGAFYTASIHYIHRTVPPDMKQSAMAVFAACGIGLAAIVGSYVGGVLIHTHGYRFMFGCYGVVSLVALVVFLLFVKEPPLRKQP